MRNLGGDQYLFDYFTAFLQYPNWLGACRFRGWDFSEAKILGKMITVWDIYKVKGDLISNGAIITFNTLDECRQFLIGKGRE